MANSLTQALLEIQMETPKLQMDKLNPHFGHRFLSLGALMGAIMPVLNEHGVIWLTLPGRDSTGHPALHYRMVHAATGETLEGAIPLMIQQGTPQNQGSALTYARRYALMAVLGLVADEDDDGNGATEAANAPQTPTAPAAEPGEAMSDADLAKVVAEMSAELKKDKATWATITAWAKEREINLDEPAPDKLRTLERSFRRKLVSLAADKAKASA